MSERLTNRDAVRKITYVDGEFLQVDADRVMQPDDILAMLQSDAYADNPVDAAIDDAEQANTPVCDRKESQRPAKTKEVQRHRWYVKPLATLAIGLAGSAAVATVTDVVITKVKTGETIDTSRIIDNAMGIPAEFNGFIEKVGSFVEGFDKTKDVVETVVGN